MQQGEWLPQTRHGCERGVPIGCALCCSGGCACIFWQPLVRQQWLCRHSCGRHCCGCGVGAGWRFLPAGWCGRMVACCSLPPWACCSSCCDPASGLQSGCAMLQLAGVPLAKAAVASCSCRCRRRRRHVGPSPAVQLWLRRLADAQARCLHQPAADTAVYRAITADDRCGRLQQSESKRSILQLVDVTAGPENSTSSMQKSQSPFLRRSTYRLRLASQSVPQGMLEKHTGTAAYAGLET